MGESSRAVDKCLLSNRSHLCMTKYVIINKNRQTLGRGDVTGVKHIAPNPPKITMAGKSRPLSGNMQSFCTWLKMEAGYL